MAAISLDTTLMQRVNEAANAKTIQPEELVDAAVRAYLRQLDRERIRSEAQAFQRQHSELVEKYLGQFVAVYNGGIVDYDMEFEILHKRIRQKYGNQPVLLRRVETEPERELVFRSPRLEKA